jgi:hypothetical protein
MKDKTLKMEELGKVNGGTIITPKLGFNTMTPSDTTFPSLRVSGGSKAKEVSEMFLKAKSVYDDALTGTYPKFYIDGCKAEYDKALDIYLHTF